MEAELYTTSPKLRSGSGSGQFEDALRGLDGEYLRRVTRLDDMEATSDEIWLQGEQSIADVGESLVGEKDVRDASIYLEVRGTVVAFFTLQYAVNELRTSSI